jgi:hypothetical protein
MLQFFLFFISLSLLINSRVTKFISYPIALIIIVIATIIMVVRAIVHIVFNVIIIIVIIIIIVVIIIVTNSIAVGSVSNISIIIQVRSICCCIYTMAVRLGQ